MNPFNPQHGAFHFRQLMVVLALMLSLASFNAQAEDLSDSTIRAFIATIQDAQALQDKYEDTEGWPDPAGDGVTSMPDMTRIFSDGVEKMEGTPAFSEFENVVEKHGFDSLEAWASVGDRVFGAMMAIKMKGQDPGARQEMAEAMAEIENNPNMSAQQKAQMRAMMGAAMGMTKMADNVPAADIEAVKPHLKALEASMNTSED